MSKNQKMIQSQLKYLRKHLLPPERPFIRNHVWRDYALSLGLVLLASVLGQPFSPTFDHANLVMFYLLAVVIAAIRFGLGPSILAAVASVIAFHILFVLPHFTFAIDEAQYLVTLSGLVIVGLVISTLTARVREQAYQARNREAQTATLYELARVLAAAVGLEAVGRAVNLHIKQVFRRDAAIFLPDENGLSVQSLGTGESLSAQEAEVAEWCFQHGQPAGRGTAHFPTASFRYHPLKTAQGMVGVISILPNEAVAHPLTPSQIRLLETFANQAAVAIERLQLAEQAQQAQLLRETEKLQTALLNSISHDLRTPLASITGTLSSLHDEADYLNEETKRELVDNAWAEADRLNRLVANLLDMTRLQAGGLKAAYTPCDVQDLIGSVLAELTPRLQERMVNVSLPLNLPLILVDFVLISRVLSNLLDNAIKYSPPDTPIEVCAEVAEEWLEIEVIDHGLGIPVAEQARVFEKFYQVPRTDGGGGTGLGLSICKGIVEIHGGQIEAKSRTGCGTVMTVRLPVHQHESKITKSTL